MHLYFPQIRVGRGITKGITDAELDAVAAELADGPSRSSTRAEPGATTRALLVDEVRWTIDVLELLTDDARARLAGDSTLGSVPQAQRDDFAARLADADRSTPRALARPQPSRRARRQRRLARQPAPRVRDRPTRPDVGRLAATLHLRWPQRSPEMMVSEPW